MRRPVGGVSDVLVKRQARRYGATSYNRCSRSVMASQNLCNSALLWTGPAATPNISIDFQGMP